LISGRAVVATSLAHKGSTLDARNIDSLVLVVSGGGLHQRKLDILTLNQVLVLGVCDANGRVVDENILSGMLSVIHCNKTIASLVIEPLNLAKKANRLGLGDVRSILLGAHVI
jgi:hypothetical protein